MVDQDCVRVLLLYLDRQLSPDPNRKRIKPVSLNAAVSQSPLDGYPVEEIFKAAQYIVTKEYALVSAKDKRLIPHIHPKKYQFTALTSKGLDLIPVLSDDSGWLALKTRLGQVFEVSLSQLLAIGAEIGLNSLLR